MTSLWYRLKYIPHSYFSQYFTSHKVNIVVTDRIENYHIWQKYQSNTNDCYLSIISYTFCIFLRLAIYKAIDFKLCTGIYQDQNRGFGAHKRKYTILKMVWMFLWGRSTRNWYVFRGSGLTSSIKNTIMIWFYQINIGIPQYSKTINIK